MPSDCEYSKSELGELLKLQDSLAEEIGWFNYKPGSNGWRALHGDASEHPATLFIHALDSTVNDNGFERERDERIQRLIAKELLLSIATNEAEFFEVLSKCLKLRREGKSFKSLTREELNLPKISGRPLKSHDIKLVFPIALSNAVTIRIPEWCFQEDITGKRITRNELKERILEKQKQYGLKDAVMLNNGYLSTLLTKYNCNHLIG